jgi:hypothetical protein
MIMNLRIEYVTRQFRKYLYRYRLSFHNVAYGNVNVNL